MPIETILKFTCDCGNTYQGTKGEFLATGGGITGENTTGELVTCAACKRHNKPTAQEIYLILDPKGFWRATGRDSNKNQYYAETTGTVQTGLARIIQKMHSNGVHV